MQRCQLEVGSRRGARFRIFETSVPRMDRIVYDNTTGALLFDSDGVGGAAAVQFAELSTGLALTNLDFLVV